jgi:hypothetical protein
MLESEIQHHSLNRQIAEALNDDHSGSLLRFATAIDAQALPHNNRGKVAFPNAVALEAAFESMTSGQRQSISIKQ